MHTVFPQSQNESRLATQATTAASWEETLQVWRSLHSFFFFPFYKVDEEVRNFGFSPNVEGIFGLIMNFRTYIKK